MKTHFLYIFLLLTYSSISAQRYFVSFTDKSPVDVDVVNLQLSEKSIERRQSQNIIPDSTDMPVKQNYLDSLKSYGIEYQDVSKWLNGTLFDTDNDTLIPFLKSKVFVSYIHDVTQTSIGGITATDTNSYGSSWTAAEFFDIPQFHNQNNYGEEKTIAIFDGGFTGVNTASPFTHLINNNQIVDTYNFTESTNNVYKNSSHGTQVLSLIAAYQEGTYIGLSHKSQIALFVTESIPTETILEHYNWLLAAERSDSIGVDIINSSLGYYDYDYSTTNHTFAQLDGKTSVVTQAAQIAAQKGILVINASGNSHTTSAWPHINFPGDAPDVLTVGNINYNGIISSTSSRGPINNTYFKPELVAPGTNVAVVNSAGNISSTSGTSFAAPLITAYAALTWCANSHLTAKEIKELLINNSSQSDSPDNTKGYGYPMTNKVLGIEQEYGLEIDFITYTSILGKTTNTLPSQHGIYVRTTIYKNGSKYTEKVMVL